MKLDHIGWITGNIELFESFWCNLLKFKRVYESKLTQEMSTALFPGAGEALIYRYQHPTFGVDIEIHHFKQQEKCFYVFDRMGINHICLHTGSKGSREDFLKQMPDDIQKHIFNNPKGWQNIFIRDYEGNWIELRESL